MTRISALCAVAVLVTAPAVSQARASSAKGPFLPISAYDDDPFVEDAVLERMSRGTFDRESDGLPLLSNDRVAIEDESVVYREDSTTGEYLAFAWNPWSPDLEKANAAGDFAFPDEERFPLHRVERGPDGKVVLVGGLQHWLPQDLHRGMTTVFEAANAARAAAELWSGRELAWGDDGHLEVNAHAFIDFNAFFSPTAKMLFFGVVPYRLPGEPIRMFELATSWEIVAHEAGHALHAQLKPNRDYADSGYRTWSESFGDQIAMWSSLLDADRALGLVAETNGDLDQSNGVTRVGEVFAALVGAGTGLRDAFHDRKVSDTSPEVHARSVVLTGAAYRFFLAVHGGLERAHGSAQAATRAARILGVFLTRAADFAPENRMTLEDVAKAYLKVDKELFGSRYHALLVDEFTRRELLDAGSVGEWLEHEAAIPELWLAPGSMEPAVEAWLAAHLDELGVDPDSGLRLQSVEHDGVAAPGPQRTIVRVQLTLGRGAGATPFENHGILVFRANGTLADYHPPLPPADPASERLSGSSRHADARSLAGEAHRRGLDRRGAPVSIVRGPDGELTAETRVLRGEGMDAHMVVFTLDDPDGERREIVIPPLPPEQRIPVAEGLLE